MILFILTIRDRAANVYDRPSFHLNIGSAIRGFGDEINRADANNQLYQHPEDFDLYHLGEYDDNAAKFTLLDEPRQIAVGKDAKRS